MYNKFKSVVSYSQADLPLFSRKAVEVITSVLRIIPLCRLELLCRLVAENGVSYRAINFSVPMAKTGTGMSRLICCDARNITTTIKRISAPDRLKQIEWPIRKQNSFKITIIMDTLFLRNRCEIGRAHV